MKKILSLLFVFAFTIVLIQAQDSLYIYKGGALIVKRAVAQIDSVTFTVPSPLTVFSQAQDSFYIYKSGAVIAKRAIAQTDSITFATHSPLAGTFPDIDGNIYHTVRIGTQTWMIENLRTTKFRNGESIPNITNNTAWTNNTSAAWCDYNNDPAYGTVFGHLYNWYAATDSRNIAPAGWHVPTVDEWNTLENYLIANGYNYDGTTVNNKMAKSLASTTYWYPSANAGARE